MCVDYVNTYFSIAFPFLSLQQGMQSNRKYKLLTIKVDGGTVIHCVFYKEPFCIYSD